MPETQSPASESKTHDATEQRLAEIAVKKGFCTAAQIVDAFEVKKKLREMGMDEGLIPVLIKKKVLSEAQAKDIQGALKPNPVVAGFEIIEKVGQGGMGAVFRARQISMDRTVALKILPKKLANNPRFTKRFLREARLSAQLNHLNLINGIDCGEDGGYTFFAMEFVEGETVKQILKKRTKLPLEECLRIIKQIAGALSYAHSKQLIHRDIKPDNIMITPNGVAKLCDLGLARSTDVEQEDASLTLAGRAVGTPHYIAPEQARGEDDVDARADLYGLGATIYHMLAGRTLFEGQAANAIMAFHLTDSAPSLSEVNKEIPPAVSMVLSKSMAKEPENRYADVDTFIKELESAATGGKVDATSFRATTSCSMPRLTGKSGRRWALAIGSSTGPRAPVSGRGTTGPRSPVGARDTTGPRVPVSPRSTTGPVIAVGPHDGPTKRYAPVGEAPSGSGRSKSVGGETGPQKPIAVWLGAGAAAAVFVGIAVTMLFAGGDPNKPETQPPGEKVVAKTDRQSKAGRKTTDEDKANNNSPAKKTVLPKDVAAPAQPTIPRPTEPPKTFESPQPEPPKVVEPEPVKQPPTPEPPPATEVVSPEPDPAPTPAPAEVAKPVPEGPDPRIPTLRARFLGEFIKTTYKQKLSKAADHLQTRAEAPEYKPAKKLIDTDLALLQEMIAFEIGALEALAKAKAEVELPENMARMAGSKKAKAKGFDKSRGLVVTVSQAELTLGARNLPPKQIIAASPSRGDAYLAAAYHLCRAELDKARALLPAIVDAKRPAMEERLKLLAAGEAEVAAETAFASVESLFNGKQWERFLEAADTFEGKHADTDCANASKKKLADWRSAATMALNPLSKFFNAKTVKSLPDGFVELEYDFSKPKQLEDFTCPRTKHSLENGWMMGPVRGKRGRKFPEKAQFNLVHLKARIAEIRSLSVTGRTVPTKGFARGPAKNFATRVYLGVSLASAPTLAFPQHPSCYYRATDQKILMALPVNTKDGKGRTRTTIKQEQHEGRIRIDKGLSFRLTRTANGQYRWAAGKTRSAPFALASKPGGYHLVMGGYWAIHAWKNLRIVIKPDPAWVEEMKKPKEAPNP